LVAGGGIFGAILLFVFFAFRPALRPASFGFSLVVFKSIAGEKLPENSIKNDRPQSLKLTSRNGRLCAILARRTGKDV
jgi:hypothetical protein